MFWYIVIHVTIARTPMLKPLAPYSPIARQSADPHSSLNARNHPSTGPYFNASAAILATTIPRTKAPNHTQNQGTSTTWMARPSKQYLADSQ